MISLFESRVHVHTGGNPVGEGKAMNDEHQEERDDVPEYERGAAWLRDLVTGKLTSTITRDESTDRSPARVPKKEHSLSVR